MEFNSNFATTTGLNLINSFTGQFANTANQAAASSQDLWLSFFGINWTTPTWDLIILLFLIVSVLIYSFTLGRDRIVAVLVSTYLALAVTTNLPFMNKASAWLSQNQVFGYQIPVFLLVFAILFFMLSRSALTQGISNLSGSWWQVVVLSLLQVGLLISIILSFLPQTVANSFSEFTKIIFISDWGKFCWIILPILALVFFQPKTAKRFDMSKFDLD
ncbi:MAG: hypothetical protein WCW26_04985 [Candidatus Buchananbacteria bacterium]